ncbi:5'-nucleotidase C-terminal domain-containing protein [Roseobacter sp. YSTF-M11]|uniref:5'-nucleotidase C-terminal domain-containing protein n=1 Tax=Roseobacter insulae TaxID=2859783 RepID=A0A9X1FXA3_9RHOB|nr:5'-nucleotidase C-terminal domain-containing protein [Roseobacter insulae]
MHMQLIAYDYVQDHPTKNGSLAKLATLIRTARQEAEDTGATCVLLDNGDTLQGTPVSDFLAQHKDVDAHPMVEAMNSLGFDAIGLGNHDLDYGVAQLTRWLNQFAVPVLSSNLRCAALNGLVSHTVLHRAGVTDDGQTRSLRIGVVSAMPQQTAAWNRHQLDGEADVSAPAPALETAISQACSAGADVVVALAHMGIATIDEGEDAQNQVIDIAHMAGVHAVVGGHTHLRFPGPDHRGVAGIDCRAGLIGGVPVVMPGSSGSDLGVIDLRLSPSDQGSAWNVTACTSELRSACGEIPEDPGIVSIGAAAHEKTRAYLAQPVARLAAPMHSFFALAQPSHVPSLMAAAKRHAIARAIAGTDLSSLPLLAAAATPATGGFDGPDNFVFLPEGELKRRHVAGLLPYANQVWAVRANGARIAGWLERSALLYNVLHPGNDAQMLVDPQVPGFRYDALYGLSYAIDPTRAPRFDAAGRAVSDEHGRVSDIRWQGKLIEPDQEFLVAVTDHRAGGGGVFRPFSDDEIVVREAAPLDEALMDYLEKPDCQAVRSAAPWRFVPHLGVRAILHTAPEALEHLSDIASLNPKPCGVTAEGFLRLRLQL